MIEMTEEFRDITNYRGLYQVSNLGRVKSLKKNNILKNTINDRGYEIVGLFKKNHNLKVIKVHQLVAIAFLNYVPNGNRGLVVDHINNNRLDNNLENLQLITHRLNTSKDKKNKTSKYTGVYFNTKQNKYLANIRINQKIVYLGAYYSEDVAGAMYQKALRNLDIYTGDATEFRNYIKDLLKKSIINDVIV